jgi:hypothetical protein
MLIGHFNLKKTISYLHLENSEEEREEVRNLLSLTGVRIALLAKVTACLNSSLKCAWGKKMPKLTFHKFRKVNFCQNGWWVDEKKEVERE